MCWWQRMGPEDAPFLWAVSTGSRPRAIFTPAVVGNAVPPVLYRSTPSHWGSSVFSMNSSSKASGFLCVHCISHNLCSFICDFWHVIPSTSLWFHSPQEAAHWGLKSCEGAVELKAEPHFATQNEKRWPICEVVPKRSDQTPTTLA